MNPLRAAHTIIPLVLLTFTLHTYCSFVPDFIAHSPPLMNAYASSTGQVSILKDLDGYFVYADLAYSTSTGQVGPDTVKMSLGLSNSHVLLIDSCLDFQAYNCPYYHCSKDSTQTISVNYPYFTVSAIQASASFYLDNSYWQLQEKALLATNCSTQHNDSIGTSRSGVIGLGTQGGSLNNFLKNKLFSLSINSDLLSGSLNFTVDYEYTYYTIGNLTSGANWIVPCRGFIQNSESNWDFDGNIAFDINADALGFPPQMFKVVVGIITNSQWLKSVVCTNDTFQPTCNYTGYVKDLPHLYICTGQRETCFIIPPEIYVVNAKSADDYVYEITLNFKALNSSFSGDSYVTSDFDNTIIFDARSMSPFYFVFNATGSTNYVQVYDAKVRPAPYNRFPKWVGAVIGIVLLVLIVGCAVGIKKRSNRAPAQAQATLIAEDNSNYVNPVVPGYGYGYGYQQQQNNN